ncbi:MAG TPA: hypothetical protein VJV75_09390 [Candidatus Polarisedimenticolia bacterium]|nr:hypothetical protein [Candidatus Polarisedimenticolia bacterium]
MPIVCTSRILRHATIVIIGALIAYGRVSAYGSQEHQDVTNAAWAVALSTLTDAQHSALKASLEADESVAGDWFKPPTVEGYRSPGYVTQAVDCFSEPERFAPDDAKGDAHTDAQYFAEKYFSKLRHRCEDQDFMRTTAMQTNRSHFQEGAASHYFFHHGRALQEAKRGHLKGALAHELLAQHYLQDFSAPGHLVAFRDTNLGTVSGDIHDRYNAKGLNVTYDLSAWSRQKYDDPMLRATLAASKAFSVDSADLQGMAGNGQLRAYGDHELCCNPRAAASLILISAQSMREVMTATSSGRGMALCYRPRLSSGERCDLPPDPEQKTPPSLNVTAICTSPLAAQVIQDFDYEAGSRPAEDGAVYCPREASAIWSAQDEMGPNKSWWPWDVKTRVLSFSLEGVRSHELQGHQYSATYFSWASADGVKVKKLSEDKTYVTYPETARGERVVAGGFGGSFARWDFHEAYAIHAEGWWLAGQLWRLDFTLSPIVGLEYMRSSERDTWRPFIGIRGGVGFSAIFLEVGVRRGFLYQTPVELDDETITTWGVRFALAPSWLGSKDKPDPYPFKPRPCDECKKPEKKKS